VHKIKNSRIMIISGISYFLHSVHKYDFYLNIISSINKYHKLYLLLRLVTWEIRGDFSGGKASRISHINKIINYWEIDNFLNT